jgi:hypothetical protein
MICPSSADWRCRICGVLGHKQSECKKESFSDHGDDLSSESDVENDNKDENHVGPWLRLAVMQNGCSIFPDYKRVG